MINKVNGLFHKKVKIVDNCDVTTPTYSVEWIP